MATHSDLGDEGSTDVSAGGEALDAVELLINDHEQALELFDEYQQLVTDSASPGDRHALAEQIFDVLTAHMTVEEELLYPAARLELGDAELIDHAAEEHGAARALIARLRSLEPADTRYDRTVRELYESFEGHVIEEENGLFTRLDETSLDLLALGAEIARRKEEVQAELLDDNP